MEKNKAGGGLRNGEGFTILNRIIRKVLAKKMTLE